MVSSVREKMIQVEKEKKRAAAHPVETELVRARDGSGHFIPDDPSTPENEAWVEKPKKKTTPKKESKKAPAKKRGRPSK